MNDPLEERVDAIEAQQLILTNQLRLVDAHEQQTMRRELARLSGNAIEGAAELEGLLRRLTKARAAAGRATELCAVADAAIPPVQVAPRGTWVEVEALSLLVIVARQDVRFRGAGETATQHLNGRVTLVVDCGDQFFVPPADRDYWQHAWLIALPWASDEGRASSETGTVDSQKSVAAEMRAVATPSDSESAWAAAKVSAARKARESSSSGSSAHATHLPTVAAATPSPLRYESSDGDMVTPTKSRRRVSQILAAYTPTSTSPETSSSSQAGVHTRTKSSKRRNVSEIMSSPLYSRVDSGGESPEKKSVGVAGRSGARDERDRN